MSDSRPADVSDTLTLVSSIENEEQVSAGSVPQEHRSSGALCTDDIQGKTL